MKRLNITLPEQLVMELSGFPNKSYFIAMAVKEKLEREKNKN